MLLFKLDPTYQNTRHCSTQDSEIKNCENVHKVSDFQRRLANCFNKDFGSNSRSFSGRKFRSRITFGPQELGRTHVITARKPTNHCRHRDPRTFCLDAKLAGEKFCVVKVWTSSQDCSSAVIDQSCQKLQPKYSSTSSPLRSH